MFKPTAPQLSRIRLRLNTKQVNKGYYKGNRTGSMGAHTPHGHYIIDYRKVRTYVCPDHKVFENFELTPFVSREIEPAKFMRPTRDAETGELLEVEVKAPDGMNGNDFLRELEEQNPDEVKELSIRTDEAVSEETERDSQPSEYFGRTWDDLEPEEQKKYANQQAWEKREARRERRVSRWYQGIEEKTKGMGLGGSTKRKIRA